MVRRSRCVVTVLGACTLALGCELKEITVPQGEPVVVVHAVLNVEEPTQFVILEYSLTGRDQGFLYSSGLTPPGPAGEGRPIEGATVTLTHWNPGDCPTPRVFLTEQPPVPFGDGSEGGALAPSGTYVTGDLCPLAPGDRVDLRVETRAGEVVTGQTVIPGAQSIDVRTGLAAENLELHRGTDSIRIDVDPIAARALILELGRDLTRTPDVYPGSLLLGQLFTLATDTMGVVLAGDLISFDDEDDGEAVFRGGRYYTLTVAVADTNYFDFVRSFSDPLTGRGFINHLDGGIGVFGSVLTSHNDIRVIDDQDDPREGLYRVTGSFDGTPVDAVLDVYLDPRQGNVTSAFVDGTWVDGPIATSGDGSYWFNVPGSGSVSGRFDTLFTTVSADTVFYELVGFPGQPDRPFDVIVTSIVDFVPAVVDTLTAERIN
jgi:hypothetical protein